MLHDAERPLIVAGGGIINADASDLLVEFAEITGVPVIPTLMGWGTIPDDHPLMAGMVGLQTSHRYGNATMLASDFVLGIGNRWANRHTGSVDVYTQGPQVRARRHRADPDRPRVRARLRHRVGRQGRARAVRRSRAATQGRRKLKDRSAGSSECRERKRTDAAQDQLRERADEAAARLPVHEQCFGRDACYVSTIGLSQIAGAQFLHVYKPRHWINCGQAGPLGWTVPAALGVRAADPTRKIVALSGDYDFQFLIEELAVGAQFKLPYLHIAREQRLPRADPPGAARLRHGLRVQLASRTSTRRKLGGVRRRPCQGRRGPGLQGDPRAAQEEIDPAIEQAYVDGGVQGAGGRRDHSRARHQHLDGPPLTIPGS